jgi:hypothetical protein
MAINYIAVEIMCNIFFPYLWHREPALTAGPSAWLLSFSNFPTITIVRLYSVPAPHPVRMAGGV